MADFLSRKGVIFFNTKIYLTFVMNMKFFINFATELN